jgi:hypothetical protein
MSVSGWSGLYNLLGSFTNLKQSKAAGLIVTIVAAAAGYVGNEFAPRDPVVSVPVSEGQKQLLENGLAGKPAELNGRLSRTVRDYFAEKGYPCDPITASETVGETVERAKACAAPVPPPPAPGS